MPDSELLRCIEKRELVAMAMALAAPSKHAAGEFAAPAKQAAGEFATPQSCNSSVALLQLGAYRTQRKHIYVLVTPVKQAAGEFAMPQSCNSSVALLQLVAYRTQRTHIYVFVTPVKQAAGEFATSLSYITIHSRICIYHTQTATVIAPLCRRVRDASTAGANRRGTNRLARRAHRPAGSRDPETACARRKAGAATRRSPRY